jgi:hypothetical protein
MNLKAAIMLAVALALVPIYAKAKDSCPYPSLCSTTAQTRRPTVINRVLSVSAADLRRISNVKTDQSK